MLVPCGPGAVDGMSCEHTRSPWLLECIVQPAAAEAGGVGSPGRQQVWLPMGMPGLGCSKLTLVPSVPPRKNCVGHAAVAGDSACAAEAPMSAIDASAMPAYKALVRV